MTTLTLIWVKPLYSRANLLQRKIIHKGQYITFPANCCHLLEKGAMKAPLLKLKELATQTLVTPSISAV